MERGPRQQQAGRKRGEGDFLPLWNFHVFFLLEMELTGVFLFASGKVHLFHRYNDVNKMKAAAKMIKIVLKSCFFSP